MLAIITCFESTTEDQSIGLYRSLAKYATYSRGLRVFGVCPRVGFSPSPAAIDTARNLGVEYVCEALNTEFADYPLINKPLSCSRVAHMVPDADGYLFLDSDTLFLRPVDFRAHVGADVSARPVDQKNIGIAAFDDENGPYWKTMYDFLGTSPQRRIRPSTSDIAIFEYYNSGYVFVRDPVIFHRWIDLCRYLLRNGLGPASGNYFVEQSSLSACITAHAQDVSELSNDLNYPLPLHETLLERARIPDLSDVRNIHYHRMYSNRAKRERKIRRSGLGVNTDEVVAFLLWGNDVS